MNYPLFDDTVVIVILNDKSVSVKHIPNDKYNVSEDLSLKIKEVFNGKNCNIIFGGTINEQNVIGLFGDEKFRSQSHLNSFYKYLIEYSNYRKYLTDIKKEIGKFGYIKQDKDTIVCELYDDHKAISGKVPESVKQVINVIINKYKCFSFNAYEKDEITGTYFIEIFPTFKQHKLIPGLDKSSNNVKQNIKLLLFNDKVKLVEDKLAKGYDIPNYDVKANEKSGEIYIELFDGGIEWYESSEYINDFQQQYGYEPSQDNMYYNYIDADYDKLVEKIENILKPEFENIEWDVSTEYKDITCIIKI